jgi:hypothetical protein
VGVAVGSHRSEELLRVLADIVLVDADGTAGAAAAEGLLLVHQQGRRVVGSVQACFAYSLSHSPPQVATAALWLLMGTPQPLALLASVFLNVILEVRVVQCSAVQLTSFASRSHSMLVVVLSSLLRYRLPQLLLRWLGLSGPPTHRSHRFL